jgi:hypothetical protein
MRAMLPIGIVLLVAWVLWLAAEIASGETQRGFSVVSAVLGLVTSLTIIANGWYYRRESARSR